MREKVILGNRLKYYRNILNMSQQKLASLVGVSRNTISSIETEVFIPSAKLAYFLCVALDVKFEELFYIKKTT